jgi:predicted CoA-binding protein
MTSKAAVDDFVSQKTLALVGMSRQSKKFGNYAFRELTQRGYRVFPIHPVAENIEGEKCYPSLSRLPETVGGVVAVVPPAQTEKVVRDAAAAGIKRVWMQQGAGSPDAIRFCQENGISEVHGECILMFASPVKSVHNFHRWIWRLVGKLPK